MTKKKCDPAKVGKEVEVKDLKSGNLELSIPETASQCREKFVTEIDQLRKDDVDQFGRKVVEFEADVLATIRGEGVSLIPNDAIGTRSDAPVLGKRVHFGKKGVEVDRNRVWVYPEFEKKDPFENLARTGRVEFTHVKRKKK